MTLSTISNSTNYRVDAPAYTTQRESEGFYIFINKFTNITLPSVVKMTDTNKLLDPQTRLPFGNVFKTKPLVLISRQFQSLFVDVQTLLVASKYSHILVQLVVCEQCEGVMQNATTVAWYLLKLSDGVETVNIQRGLSCKQKPDLDSALPVSIYDIQEMLQNQTSLQEFNVYKTPNLKFLLTGKLPAKTASDSYISLQIVSHQMMDYPQNVFINAQTTPNLMVQQGCFPVIFANEDNKEYYLNATCLNRPQQQPRVKQQLQDYYVNFNFRGTQDFAKFQQHLKSQLIKQTVPSVEGLYKCKIEQQSVTVCIEKYFLALNGVSDLTTSEKVYALPLKEENGRLLAAKNNIQLVFNKENKISICLIAQLSISFAGASDKEIDEMYEESLLVCLGSQEVSSLNGRVVLQNMLPKQQKWSFVPLKNSEIQVFINAQLGEEEQIDRTGLVAATILPPSKYYAQPGVGEGNKYQLDQIGEDKDGFGDGIQLDLDKIKQLNLDEPEEVKYDGQQIQFQAYTDKTTLSGLNKNILYPQKVTLRIYQLCEVQKMLSSHIIVKIICASSFGERRCFETPVMPSDFSDPFTLTPDFVLGCLVQVVIQVFDAFPAAILRQQVSIPIVDNNFVDKIRADGGLVIQQNKYTKFVLSGEFFDLELADVNINGLFQEGGETVSILQCQFETTRNDQIPIESLLAPRINFTKINQIKELKKQQLSEEKLELNATDVFYAASAVAAQSEEKFPFFSDENVILSARKRDQLFKQFIVLNDQQWLKYKPLFQFAFRSDAQLQMKLLYPPPSTFKYFGVAVKSNVPFNYEKYEYLVENSDFELQFYYEKTRHNQTLGSQLKVSFAILSGSLDLGRLDLEIKLLDENVKQIGEVCTVLPYRIFEPAQLIYRLDAVNGVIEQVSPGSTGLQEPPPDCAQSQESIEVFCNYRGSYFEIQPFLLPGNSNNQCIIPEFDGDLGQIIKERYLYFYLELQSTDNLIKGFNELKVFVIKRNSRLMNTTNQAMRAGESELERFVFSWSLNVFLADYCELAAGCCRVFQLPQFGDLVASYPPSIGGQLMLLSPGISYVQMKCSQNVVIAVVKVEDVEKIQHKYFLKLKRNILSTKQLEFSQNVEEPAVLCELTSLVRAKKPKMAEDTWRIFLKFQRVWCAGYRRGLRIYIPGMSPVFVYYLEVLWE